MKVTLTINEAIPGRNTREHFFVYKKRRDRYEIEIMGQCRLKFTGKVQVKLTRYSRGEMDYDNLVSCGKPVLDAIKRAGIIEDDKMKIVGVPTYLQVKIKKPDLPKYVIEIWQDENN